MLGLNFSIELCFKEKREESISASFEEPVFGTEQISHNEKETENDDNGRADMPVQREGEEEG